MKLLASALAFAYCAQVAHSEEFIVFVHGLSGYGRDELNGGYWGNKELPGGQSYVEWMAAKTGLKAFEASVGPFSSNWDRACELYAQIKGLKTDYGKSHSNRNAHSRWGRDFSGSGSYYKGGFFPSWNAANKVHLIGHSMGGTTIRMLERLLQQGDAAETALKNVASTGATSGGYVNDVAMSDLFQTGTARNWIASVTTIATPFDGTTLHTILDSTGIPVTNILRDVLLFVGAAFGDSAILGKFNLDLGHHYEFSAPNPGETLKQYTARIFTSPKWRGGYTDFADYDLSPHSLKVFNAAGPRVFSGTRYFAVQTWASKTCALNWNDQCADLNANPGLIMKTSCDIMGSVDDLLGNNDVKDKWGDVYNDSWEPNDGAVPRRSSTGPTYGVASTAPGAPILHPTSFGKYVYTKTSLATARWYYTPLNLDHLRCIGGSTQAVANFQHIANIINGIKYA